MANNRTGAQIVCETLINEGVEVVFGLPGGAVLPLYGVLGQYTALRHVLVRHEQAAAMAADGYARVTGKAGSVSPPPDQEPPTSSPVLLAR